MSQSLLGYLRPPPNVFLCTKSHVAWLDPPKLMMISSQARRRQATWEEEVLLLEFFQDDQISQIGAPNHFGDQVPLFWRLRHGLFGPVALTAFFFSSSSPPLLRSVIPLPLLRNPHHRLRPPSFLQCLSISISQGWTQNSRK